MLGHNVDRRAKSCELAAASDEIARFFFCCWPPSPLSDADNPIGKELLLSLSYIFAPASDIFEGATALFESNLSMLSSIMNPAYISALSVLFGSAIGAFASVVTTQLSHRHQDDLRRRTQEHARRERIFIQFIDLCSDAFVDALMHTSIENPSKLVPLYATMGKLRLFASEETVAGAENVMNRVIETYYTPKLDFHTKPTVDPSSDILREFSEKCRAELAGFSPEPLPRKWLNSKYAFWHSAEPV